MYVYFEYPQIKKTEENTLRNWETRLLRFKNVYLTVINKPINLYSDINLLKTSPETFMV